MVSLIMVKTDNDTAEIMLEHLREIRRVLDQHSLKLKDLQESMISMRSDFLRLERGLAAVETDVDRINTRLDLRDQ